MSTKASTSFELSRLQLTSLASGVSVDLRLVALEINIYESIFSNVLSGDLTISDSNNLISNVPIYGYEVLEVSFKSNMDASSSPYSKTFRVTNVEKVSPSKERNATYVINFSSPTDLLNESISVSQSFSRKRISDMVYSICKSYLSITPDTLEPTKYLHDMVIPYMDPLTAINLLSSRAVSDTFKGAFYMFYENRDGYHFRSIESNIIQKPSRIFLLQPANIRLPGSMPDDTTDILAIQDYSFETLPNVLQNTMVGMYGSRLMVHSLVQKVWRIHDFDYVKTYKDFQHTEPAIRRTSVNASTLAQLNPFATTFNDETRLGGPGLNSPNSLMRLMPFDEEKVQVTVPLSTTNAKPLIPVQSPELPKYDEEDKNEFPSDAGKLPRTPKSLRESRLKELPDSPTIPQPEPNVLKPVDTTNTIPSSSSNVEKGFTFVSRQKVERWLLQRDSQKQAMFENIRFVATVPGTIEVTIGDIVEIRLPSPEPVTKNNPQKLDKYYSGRYLVVNVRHRIAQGDNAYFTILECVKDAVNTGYPL